MAERMLERADSLDAPLSAAMNEATAIALQEMTAHEENLASALSAVNAVVWFWLLGGVVALGLLALFLRRRLHMPLARLDEALDRISAGDLGVQLEHDHPDEFGRLVQQFNRMTAVLRLPAADAAIFESTWPVAGPTWLAEHRVGHRSHRTGRPQMPHSS